MINASLPFTKLFLVAKGQDLALKIENITSGTVDISSRTEQIIKDIEKALKESNFKILKVYESDIAGLNEQMIWAMKK